MFRGTLLEPSPNHGPWLSPRAKRIASLAGLAAFALGALTIPHLPWFRSPWSWLEGGMAAAFVALFYALMVSFVDTDSRRAGLRARTGLAAVLIFNVGGLVGYLIASAHRTGDWKRIALPLAYLFEALLLGVCVTIPLISTAALPKISWLTPVPPPPSGTRNRAAPKGPRPSLRPLTGRVLRIPQVIPLHVSETEIPPEGPQPLGVGDYRLGVPNGIAAGGFEKMFGGQAVSAPSPAPAKAKAPDKPLLVSGGVEAAKLIDGPTPEYPVIARMSHTEGAVHLKAIIGRDGTIQELRVLDGHPLLVKAAVEAVERWRYSPTLLDGNPVEVETEIEVKFKLSD